MAKKSPKCPICQSIKGALMTYRNHPILEKRIQNKAILEF